MATVPVQRTWAVGEIVTALELNSNIRDCVNFMLAAPRVALTRSTSVGLSGSGSPGLYGFDVELIDTDSMHSGGDTKVFANTPGLYECWVQVHHPYINNSANGILVAVFLTKDTLGVFSNAKVEATDSRRISTNSGLGTSAYCSKDILMNVGDSLEAWGLQNTGVTMTIPGDAFDIQFNVQWVASS